MSHNLVDIRPITVPQPMQSAPATGERRRPGRVADVSPELIALMRKPTNVARMKVAMYDAPGFLLPTQHRRPPASGRSLAHATIAFTACSVAAGAALQAMLAVWG